MKFIDLFAGIGGFRLGMESAGHLLKSGFRIRKLTPRECWRLQGFPDWAFDKAAYGQVIPDNYQDKLLCRTM